MVSSQCELVHSHPCQKDVRLRSAGGFSLASAHLEREQALTRSTEGDCLSKTSPGL